MKNLGFFLILFFISIASEAAETAETKTAIKTETMKSAIIGKPPFGWETDGKRQGFHYDIAEAIANRSGYQADIQMVPVMRTIELLRSNSVDFIILTDYKELDEMKAKKILLLEVVSSVFSLKSKPIQSKQDLKNGTIARLGRGCNGLNDEAGVQWLDVQSYEQAYDLLKAGRVRGVCSTIAFWPVVVKKGSKKDIAEFQVNKTTVWVRTLPTIDDEKFKKIQKAVKSLIKDGTVEKLAIQYVEGRK